MKEAIISIIILVVSTHAYGTVYSENPGKYTVKFAAQNAGKVLFSNADFSIHAFANNRRKEGPDVPVCEKGPDGNYMNVVVILNKHPNERVPDGWFWHVYKQTVMHKVVKEYCPGAYYVFSAFYYLGVDVNVKADVYNVFELEDIYFSYNPENVHNIYIQKNNDKWIPKHSSWLPTQPVFAMHLFDHGNLTEGQKKIGERYVKMSSWYNNAILFNSFIDGVDDPYSQVFHRYLAADHSPAEGESFVSFVAAYKYAIAKRKEKRQKELDEKAEKQRMALGIIMFLGGLMDHNRQFRCDHALFVRPHYCD
jgi:hypothetical protein